MAERKHIPDHAKIRARRDSVGLTREVLAAKSNGDISSRSVQDIEGGERASMHNLQVIARVLGGSWTDYLDKDALENTEALQTRSYTLLQCMSEMFALESTLSPEVPLDVDTIGIDLAQGWEFIANTILQTKAKKVNFRILMLTWNNNELPDDSPQEVRGWSILAGHNLDLVRNRSVEYLGPKVVTIHIKTYSDLPTRHGVDARKGDVGRLVAVTECRWLEGTIPTYSFGDGEYRLFNPSECSFAEQDLFCRFRSLFEHLWSNGQTEFDTTLD